MNIDAAGARHDGPEATTGSSAAERAAGELHTAGRLAEAARLAGQLGPHEVADGRRPGAIRRPACGHRPCGRRCRLPASSCRAAVLSRCRDLRRPGWPKPTASTPSDTADPAPRPPRATPRAQIPDAQLGRPGKAGLRPSSSNSSSADRSAAANFGTYLARPAAHDRRQPHPAARNKTNPSPDTRWSEGITAGGGRCWVRTNVG